MRPEHGTYRPDIDGLRAIAVGSVVAFHFAPSFLPGGFLGVDIFFVISGFLISGMIFSGLRAGTFSLLDFYLRRARRILPALLTVLVVVSLLALLFLMPDELAQFGRNLTAGALFVPNLQLLRESGYFDAASDSKPLLHLWSLGVEEQFYLFWPLILAAIMGRHRSPRFALGVMAVLALASFALHVALAAYAPTTAFYLPFTRFWELLIGALLAATPRFSAGHGPRARHVASITGLALIGIAVMTTPRGAEYDMPRAVLATLGAAALIAAGAEAVVNRVLLSRRAMVYVGLISFPLYLWHWPLLCFAGSLEIDVVAVNRIVRIAAFVLAVAAAMLTCHFIELPIRRRAPIVRLAVQSLAGLAIVAIAGLGFTASHGLPERTKLGEDPFAWPAAMRSDAACLAQHAPLRDHAEDSFCLRNDFTREPQVVLIGDSQANALWPGVEAGYADASAMMVGASACPFLRNTRFWRTNTPNNAPKCPLLIDAAYDAIPNSASVVILTAHMAAYTATPAEDQESFNHRASGTLESAEFPGASELETYRRSLSRDLEYLLGRGLEVILVLDVPELDFSPRHCVDVRPIDALLPDSRARRCTLPRASVEARQAAYRRETSRVVDALQSKRLHVVDPLTALCDRTTCFATNRGAVLYRDSHHLTADGARFVWARIAPRRMDAFRRTAAHF